MDTAQRASGVSDTSPSQAETTTDSPPAAARRHFRVAFVHRSLLTLCLAVGAAVHLRVWAAGRGFWNDELAIALNLPRPVERLAGGLLYYQVAPLGWLSLEKALHDHVSDSERVLRLPSLFASIVVLAFTTLLVHRILGRWSGLLATLLVAGAPILQQYTGELKQYAFEAAVTVSLLLLVDEYGRRSPRSSRQRWLLALAIGVPTMLLMPFSYPGVLVLGGAIAGVAVWLARQRRWADAVALAVSGIPALALSAFLILLRMSHSFLPGQQTYFTWGMPLPGSGVVGVLEWLPRMWVRFVETPLMLRFPVLVLALIVAGVVGLARRGRGRYALMLVGVMLAAVAAAAAQGLPVVDRVATYLVPPALILVTAGVDAVVRSVRWLVLHRIGQPRATPWRVAGAAAATVLASALVLLLAAPAFVKVARGMVTPSYRDSGREVLADVADRIRPGDLVVLYWFSDKLGRWYGKRYGIDNYLLARLEPASGGTCPGQRVDTVLAGHQRVWYVRGVKLSSDPADFTRRVAGELARHGRVVQARYFGTADGRPDDDADGLANGPGWVLVDLTAGPDPNPPAIAPDASRTCLVLSKP